MDNINPEIIEICSLDNTRRIKAEILEDAEKLRFENIEGIYTDPILLTFDTGSVFLSVLKWAQGDKVHQPQSSALAEIHYSINDVFPVIEGQDNIILISGAAIDGFENSDSHGLLARDCSVSFSRVTISKLNYSGLRDLELKDALRIDQSMKKAGLLRFFNGEHIKFNTTKKTEYTPLLRQVCSGPNSTQAFSQAKN